MKEASGLNASAHVDFGHPYPFIGSDSEQTESKLGRDENRKNLKANFPDTIGSLEINNAKSLQIEMAEMPRKPIDVRAHARDLKTRWDTLVAQHTAAKAALEEKEKHFKFREWEEIEVVATSDALTTFIARGEHKLVRKAMQIQIDDLKNALLRLQMRFKHLSLADQEFKAHSKVPLAVMPDPGLEAMIEEEVALRKDLLAAQVDLTWFDASIAALGMPTATQVKSAPVTQPGKDRADAMTRSPIHSSVTHRGSAKKRGFMRKIAGSVAKITKPIKDWCTAVVATVKRKAPVQTEWRVVTSQAKAIDAWFRAGADARKAEIRRQQAIPPNTNVPVAARTGKPRRPALNNGSPIPAAPLSDERRRRSSDVPSPTRRAANGTLSEIEIFDQLNESGISVIHHRQDLGSSGAAFDRPPTPVTQQGFGEEPVGGPPDSNAAGSHSAIQSDIRLGAESADQSIDEFNTDRTIGLADQYVGGAGRGRRQMGSQSSFGMIA